MAILSVALVAFALAAPAEQKPTATISDTGNGVDLAAGLLTRTLAFDGGNVCTTAIRVDGTDVLTGPAREFSVTFHRANPNRRPQGLMPGESEAIIQQATMADGTDGLQVTENAADAAPRATKWSDALTVDGSHLSSSFDILSRRISQTSSGSSRLTVHARATKSGMLCGVSIDIYYEVYSSFPVIRKWIEITNNSPNWLKIDGLVIDDIELGSAHCSKTLLTPEERGACSSVIAFGTADRSHGVIAVSEIPSALRSISDTGAMGYSNEHFEWVLGPTESFISEPVFQYAYSGQVEKTLSGVSTPLDRAVEGPFQRFLEQHIGVAADTKNIPAPLWCSWSNFGSLVKDANMREQADLARKAGFVGFQIDAGWARSVTNTNWDCGASKADPRKFPDFDATCRHIISQGLKLGLWVSCFRNPESADLKALPDCRSLPEIKRGEGLGMSFCSPWRNYFADDVVYLHDRYGATYVKQDLTDIKFGDIAEGHESRTRKESLLRGLRGLLEVQDTIRRRAPEMRPELTHEIYWGTPGVPCDIAALKHACSFHIPPNDYSGCGPNKERPNPKWTISPDELHKQLLAGCHNARQRLYAHRGLPLYTLEYYGAATVNFGGSLTPEVQDRQVCSWLMGVPAVFAGDLASLSAEHIERYRQRFEIVKRLQSTYDIFRYFQYSGVPEPTDTDWHWWGKLRDDGCGAVVVIRGSAGEAERAINIPWVHPATSYSVKALLSGRSLGAFTGAQLQEGALKLALPEYGQEILELAKA